MPALLTRMSMTPRAASAFSIKALVSSAEDRSTVRGVAATPRASHSAATASSFSMLVAPRTRSTVRGVAATPRASHSAATASSFSMLVAPRTRSTPSAASPRAMARPMPRDAPVMIAFLPVSCKSICNPFYQNEGKEKNPIHLRTVGGGGLFAHAHKKAPYRFNCRLWLR